MMRENKSFPRHEYQLISQMFCARSAFDMPAGPSPGAIPTWFIFLAFFHKENQRISLFIHLLLHSLQIINLLPLSFP